MNPTRQYLTFLWISCWILFGCESTKQDKNSTVLTPYLPTQARILTPFPYDLSHPQKQFDLNDSLKEVSGLAWLGANQLGMIQDEEGLLFCFDILQEKLVNVEEFGPRGDYEGIACDDSIVYTLESNGRIRRFVLGQEAEATRHAADIPIGSDAEGLEWDAKQRLLLIACKEPAQKGKAGKPLRQIYAFDPQADTTSAKPAYVFALPQLAAFGQQHPELILSKFDPEKKRSFMPSGIAIHPLTQDVYVLTATGRALMVVDTSQTLRALQALPKELYPQPEGICFGLDGTLYLSTEGKSKSARLYVLPYTPPITN